jgi:hypothetical protein
VSYPHILSTVPGALIGYRKNGQPIHLVAGGSGPPGEPAGTPPAQPAPSGQPPAPGAPPAQPPTPAPQPGQQPPTQDVSQLPDWTQKLISDLRGEAAASRTNAKQTAADEARQELAQTIGKALGLATGDEPADPEQLTAQLAEYQTENWSVGVENLVLRNAAKYGVNSSAVLDSVSFWESLGDLQGGNPRDSDFATQVEAAVKKLADTNPAFKAAPAGPARAGADMTGGTPPPPRERPRSLVEALKRRQ